MKKRFWEWLRRLGPPSVFASIAIALLLGAFGEAPTLSAIFREFWISMLYSICIGGILSVVIPPLWSRSAACTAALRWIARIFSIAAATALGTLLAGLCRFALWTPPVNFAVFYWHSYFIALILSFTAVTFSITFETYRHQLQTTRMQLKEKELERERALQLATTARLSSLESRVHPHFLFNTLNSVASLIHDDPKRAESMVNQLAGLLRFSLDSSQGGLVPLEREMKIVEDYLAIEKTRFAGRLRYSLEIAPGLETTPVPPLAVQTLVENAVKYAVGPRARGAAIRVSAQRLEGLLQLLVADDGPGFSCSGIPAGHGLNNLEERLAALYGDNGKLHIASSEQGTTVTLSIPLSVAKAA
jgi:two-component system sensor histidine kinase AlgZ